MKAVNNFKLCMGKLQLPLSCYKAVDNTTSVKASEVTKIDGKVYKVQRKPFVLMEDGSEKDVDKSQILKAYEKDDGTTAIFTKDEQSQLLKRGSSREWTAQAVVDTNNFKELSFQKDGLVAMVDLQKDKSILNKANLKWFSMLKAGLQDKAIVCHILYKNTQYPVVISNYEDKLLVRFVHYQDEIRNIESPQELPKLTEKETEQARAFVMANYKPDFNLNALENKTETKIRSIIESRGDNIEEIKTEETILVENPFAV